MKNWVRIVLVGSLVLAASAFAGGRDSISFDSDYPFYIGVNGGFGSTDWGMLEAPTGTGAAFVSPIAVKDTGAVWGGVVGYQFSKMFAMEFGYNRYPKAKLTFGLTSPYFDYKNLTPEVVYSTTNSYDVVGKFIVPVKGTDHFTAFASVGLGVITRSDILTVANRVGASFGVGTSFMINPHFSTELGFQYMTGFGKANDGPAYYYMPFLYDGYIQLSYHFDLPKRS